MTSFFDPNWPDGLCQGGPPLWCTSGYQTTVHFRLEYRFLEAERRHDRRVAGLFVEIDALLGGKASALLGVHGLRRAVLANPARLLRQAPPRRRRAVRERLKQYEIAAQAFVTEIDAVHAALGRLHPRWWSDQACHFESRFAALVALSDRRYGNLHFKKWSSGPQRRRRITGFHLLALGETAPLARAIRRTSKGIRKGGAFDGHEPSPVLLGQRRTQKKPEFP